MRVSRALSVFFAATLLAAPVLFWAQRSDAAFDADAVLAALEPELSEKKMEAGQLVFMRIFKREAELELWLRAGETYSLFRTYPICSYSGDLGPKLKEGDRQSPEGFYFFNRKALNPNSSYHLSSNLGFPNAFDRAQGRTGSYLMVHGDCVSIGCYAMTDDGIEEIYALAQAALDGQQRFFRVHVFPFRMTAANMEKHTNSDWFSFWNNLRDGYDHFEITGSPPDVTVVDGLYSFGTDMPDNTQGRSP